MNASSKPIDNTSAQRELDKEEPILEFHNEVSAELDFVLVKYPAQNRTLDAVILRRRDFSAAFVKFAYRISKRSTTISELRALSWVAEANSIVVSDYIGDEKTLDGVVHIRGGVTIISRSTFDRILAGEFPRIYEFNGEFYARIDSNKLRKLREEMSISMNRAAQLLHVSTIMFRKYERGESDMSIDTALKLYEIFGNRADEVIAPIDILKGEIKPKQSNLQVNRRVLNEMVKKYNPKTAKRLKLIVDLLDMHGVKYALLLNAPTDIALRSMDGKIVFISILERSDEVENKLKECVKLSEIFKGRTLALVSDDAEKMPKRAEVEAEIEKFDEDGVKELISRIV